MDAKQRLPNDDNWTGAEIRACCRLAALLDLPLVQAAQNVVPVAVTAGRVGRAAAQLGQRPLLERAVAGHLHQFAQLGGQVRAQDQPGSVQQLRCLDASHSP